MLGRLEVCIVETWRNRENALVDIIVAKSLTGEREEETHASLDEPDSVFGARNVDERAGEVLLVLEHSFDRRRIVFVILHSSGRIDVRRLVGIGAVAVILAFRRRRNDRRRNLPAKDRIGERRRSVKRQRIGERQRIERAVGPVAVETVVFAALERGFRLHGEIAPDAALRGLERPAGTIEEKIVFVRVRAFVVERVGLDLRRAQSNRQPKTARARRAARSEQSARGDRRNEYAIQVCTPHSSIPVEKNKDFIR